MDAASPLHVRRWDESHIYIPRCPEQAAFGFSELIATNVYQCSASAAARTAALGEEPPDKLIMSTASRSSKTSAMAVKLQASKSVLLGAFCDATLSIGHSVIYIHIVRVVHEYIYIGRCRNLK